MRIEQDIKLDFKDVLFKPKRSKLESRRDVDLIRTFTFHNSGNEWKGVPIMASNMDGVGTFAMAAALCSTQIKNLYTTNLLLTEHLNYTMMHNTDVDVHVMDLENYLPVFPCSWKNTEEQRKFILDYR